MCVCVCVCVCIAECTYTLVRCTLWSIKPTATDPDYTKAVSTIAQCTYTPIRCIDIYIAYIAVNWFLEYVCKSVMSVYSFSIWAVLAILKLCQPYLFSDKCQIFVQCLWSHGYSQ